ncbi:MAG TPA: hypothetical protein VJ817_10915 [Gemmatimonadales bacterium]|nr:hypothetical protein [Gemmatimonadales bacterium]
MTTTKQTESDIGREDLVRLLADQIERTFNSEGQSQGLRLVEEMLRRLDDTALRELAYKRGLTTESEGEPAPEETQ